MAKKESFSFDSEGSSFNLKQKLTQWEDNLTQKQKIIIIAIAVAVVVALIVTVVCITVANGSNDNANNNNNTPGSIGDNGEPGMFVSAPPSKTSYFVGDKANYFGLSIYYTDGIAEGIFINYEDRPDEFTVTGFDSSVPVEKQTITVEYKGFTDTFEINIKEVPSSTPRLIGISLNPAPKDTCKIGRALSVKDAMIVCEYSDGSTKSVPLDRNHLYGYEDALTNAQVGDVVTIYVRYTEDGYVAETSYTVTIVE